MLFSVTSFKAADVKKVKCNKRKTFISMSNRGKIVFIA